MRNLVLADGWRRTRLEKVAEIRTGIAKGKKGLSDPVALPYLRVANVQDGYLDLSEIKEITVEKDRIERFRVKENDILLTEGGDFDKLGRGTLWRGELPLCLHQNHVFVVRANPEKLDPQFFAYQAASPYGKWYFLSCAKQTTNLASINSSQLRDFPALVPPLPEQRKIAAILGTWDEAIGTTERLIAALERRKKGLMQQLLTGRVRFPEFVNSIEFSETNIGGIPDDWQVIKQGKIATFHNGRAYKKSEWEKSGTPVIRLQNLTGRTQDYYYSNMKLPDRQYCDNGDLLYMWSATFGPHIWQGEKAIYHYHIWKVECSPRIDKYFLYYLLSYHTESWLSNSHGLGLLHITKGTMESLEIPLPSIEEQVKIASVLRSCDEEIDLNRHRVESLRLQKKGLMQRLLTGRIRVKVD